MSVNSTTTLWKVSIEAGSVYSLRTGEWLFTNEKAANEFVKAAKKALPTKTTDVSVEEIEAYKWSRPALAQAWPFEELRAL